jgi:DNA-binding CsgD family transcriptional regulator
MINRLGQPHFEDAVLDGLYPVVPAASWSVYRTGPGVMPVLFMSASHGVPDTTRDCWRAYLSGPHSNDRTLAQEPASPGLEAAPLLCHITAQEMPGDHRARVYETHGMAERVSIVRQQGDGSVFAINFYRHTHQRAFSDTQLQTFETLAPALLELTQKHITLRGVSSAGMVTGPSTNLAVDVWWQRLSALCPELTPRELAVCARMLRGMTLEGIACDLRLALPTVKTYRSRAFARLGIHFRNELFARVLAATGPITG